MLELESRTCIANGNQEQVFAFVSDFRQMGEVLPEEIMKGVEASETDCSFDFSGLGRIGLKISERKPFSLVAITGTQNTPATFILKISLSPVSENQTKLNFYLQAGLNMWLEMMAKDPLQQFLDMLADKMEQKNFRDQE